MRIPKSWVPSMAKHIVENLMKKELIEPDISVDALSEETEKLLLEELMAEDRLNDEVRQLLRKYETDIERGRLDYRKLFDMTKQKLVRERNIIL
ncbi:MAG: hypothetical protein A2077_04420 [Nitrospirae bacterium GWC2_46_6]|nr:MAG: hypothetical protein A2077_04420 [Nitrospirae bacterium GWC2_46_6]OGW22118.1 MAG: hypothetical protein A2Z82_06595 [Nitrospirae bacterium GWA2_46_11]OGW24336.1 MAG: hypothetical protein A2X55_00075 [Nitrospirae bacterium GWB2_47_37]HAK88421.1 DUF507 domain-containing protein [Nitrospiraceae bacterium]HCL81263.1 DUF507 domain-containing protein [Nitrospiraceae bacterium]